MAEAAPKLDLPQAITALLFDLDGVLTKTALVHDKAWKQTFDEFLKKRAEANGEEFVPFDSGADYNEYVDGKPRYDGVRSFLESRGITLPEGKPDDPPEAETVCGIGNRKNDLVQELIDRDGVEVYPGSVAFVEAARDAGLRRAVVSSSANTQEVLRAAGIEGLFEERIDGNVADEQHLKGKPAPDTYLAGAKALGVEPAAACVFEDAVSGVEAGHAGHFGHVVGVDRVGHAAALREHGADVVVDDLGELILGDGTGGAEDGGRLVIEDPAYTVEPWGIRETHLNLENLAQSESVFAQSNGHIGVRGTLDEGEPAALPGTYLNAFYEARPLPYAEAGYGYPEAGETVVNMTNGKIIRLLVDDSPFDIRYGDLEEHERRIDFRTGILTRVALWRSPTGKTVRVTSERLVSFAQRAVMAIRYTVEPTVAETRVVVQSELVTNEPRPAISKDPRAAAALEAPLEAEEFLGGDARAVLVHQTKESKLRAGAAMGHEIEGPVGTDWHSEAWGDLGRTTINSTPGPGDPLTITKFVTYGWSARRSVPAVRDQVSAALAEASHTGWDELVAAQRAYLDDFWERADVELDGDAELQQAVRFGLFHALQASARGEGRAIPAKGLTGPGYDGHTFWDTEAYVLPLLSYAAPAAAAEALKWRLATIEKARERATELGLEGAAFPWRTISGAETGAYWPAGTAAFHINADIAQAVIRQCDVNVVPDFEEEVALPLLVETARLWRSLGHHDAHGAFRIDGVTGPDEYSAVADNNIYTNLLAQKNLRGAAEFAERYGEAGEGLGVDPEEIASWRDAAEAMTIPYDEDLDIHPQSENFTKHARWNFDAVEPDQYPLLLNYPYFDLYRKQVVKQADLVMAMVVCGDAFSAEEKERNFAYYEPLTVRDSSLSACMQAVIAAETGHLELAYDYLGEAALMDLDDLEHNSSDGIHIASLAGTWIAVVLGFGGLRDHDGMLSFMPRLPERLERVCFRLGYRGRRIWVEVTKRGTKFRLLDGEEAVRFRYFDEVVELGQDELEFGPPPPVEPPPDPVHQPPGRAPQRRRPSG